MGNSLTIITPAELESASQVLTTTKGWVVAYSNKHAKLMAIAKQVGTKLPKDLDQKFNDLAASTKQAIKAAEDKRKPFTQKMDEVKKLFTNEENLLKNILSSIESIRNQSAAEYAKEEAILRKQEEEKIAIETEKVKLLADAEDQIRNAYADILRGDKNELLGVFEGTTSETIDVVEKILIDAQGTFTVKQWESIVPIISSVLIDADEIEQIKTKAKEGKYEKVSAHYSAEIRNYCDHLLSLIPARREEIKAGIEKSEEAERIRENQRQIEADQEAALQARLEQEEADRIYKATIETKVAQANRAVEKPRAIESYAINVLDRNGWAEIFKFYFTNSPEQDLGKIKLDQMKLFAERQAKATGEMIRSEHIEYVPTYKAVTVSKKGAKVQTAA